MLVPVLAGLHALLWGVLLANLVFLRRTRRARTAPDAWPAVSVLIPARNEAENLRRLLPSLLAQDYPRFEVVVMDDGSEDDTGAVIAGFGERDERVRGIRGEGPPPGWVGKVHALYRATRAATGDVFCFLDADAALADPGALRRLVARWAEVEAEGDGAGAALTGLPRLRGGGKLLVSLVPLAVVSALPLALIPRTRAASLGSLNGQCWLVGAGTYREHEPHGALPAEVLEDVKIGRYLKRRGVRLALVDLRREATVWMYGSLGEAWRGFRKNAYLLQGGRPTSFLLVHGLYVLVWIVGPVLSPWLLASAWGLKATSDRAAGFPLWVSALAPASILLSALLPLDSAVSHWTGRVRWKGRAV